MNIFEMLYPRFYFDKSKPIRLFEAFAGIGCQAMALKRITDNIELVGISEIDKPAIQSYMAIHGQVKNYGDITKMVSIPPCDIFTWSFPCTDLSKAGKQKGLTDTRSGLVYEVLRLLKATTNKPKVLIMENVIDLVQVKFVKPFNEIQAELEQLGYTNYNEVLNAKDYGIPQNRERVFMVSILRDELSEHYSYDFPIRKELKLRLKDMLEDEVDEKYYLSKKALKGLQKLNQTKDISNAIRSGGRGSIDRHSWDLVAEPKLNQVAQLDGFESSGRIYDENGLAPTINTMGGGQREPKIAIKTWNDETKAYKTKENDMPRDRLYMQESIGFTITTNESQMPSILIPEATEKGYAEAHDGDGVYLNRPHQKRGVVQKGMIQTIKTSGDDIGVCVKETRNLKEKLCDELIESGTVQGGEIINHSYTNKNKNPNSRLDLEDYIETKDGIMPTLTTRADTLGVVAAEIRTDEGIRTFDDNNMGSLRTNTSCGDKAIIELSSRNNLRIRKLTPLECWRLMGISDEDFNKAKASGMSNSQLYKQAGNGIVVNVFEAILREMII